MNPEHVLFGICSLVTFVLGIIFLNIAQKKDLEGYRFSGTVLFLIGLSGFASLAIGYALKFLHKIL